MPEPIVVTQPLMMGLRALSSDAIGLLYKAATLPTTNEHPGANPLLDEWVLLARTLVDVITQL